MITLCAHSPLPAIDELLADLRRNLTFPPVLPTIHFPTLPSLPGLPSLPALPTLPSPLFPSISMPNIEFPIIALGLQQFQLLNTALGMIKPLISFLGISISAILPPFPGLPTIDLLKLLAGPPEFFINAIKKLVASIPSLPDLAALIPTIPPILFPTMGTPDLSIIKIAQHALVHYQNLLSEVIANLINQVTGKLKIPGLPTIPTMPSMGDIIAALTALIPSLPPIPSLPGIPHLTIPSIPSMTALIAHIHLPNFDFSALFSGIAFPALPALPKLPLPFNPSFSIPEYTFQDFLSMLQAHLSMGIMKPIMDFILNTLSRFLSFSFPTFCIPL